MAKYISIFVFLIISVSCKKTTVVFNGDANDNYELPLLIELDGKRCVFDAETGILKYSITESRLQGFSPYIEFQRYSDITFNSVELFNGSVNQLGDLELNTFYPITFKTDGEIVEFTMVFTSIPIVQLVTLSHIGNGQKTLARMILNYPEIERVSDNNWIGIEFRGRSSLGYQKKSFGLEIFTDKSTNSTLSQAYFGMESNEKWILDAMFVDRSKLRNRTSFDLWNSINDTKDHIGISSHFVEVYINHESQGLYAFSERYTETFLDLNSQSVLYKGTDNSEITKFIELPKYAPNSAHWIHWEQEYPDPSKEIVWDDFEALSELIVEGSDSEFKNTIGQVINLDNVIDYFLFMNLCCGIDNVGKNWFFFKRDNSAKFILVPWDMDGTWGRNPFAEELSYSTLISNNLFIRLNELNPNNYNSRLKSRWLELRSLDYSETNLTNLFSANFNELKSYHIIDIENTIWETDLNLEYEQTYITTWIHNRLGFLDERFE